MSSTFKPQPGVHKPAAFICFADPEESVVTFTENPAQHIASVLLEEIGDWCRAIEGLRSTNVPPAVAAALAELHEAVCNWSDWTTKQGGAA